MSLAADAGHLAPGQLQQVAALEQDPPPEMRAGGSATRRRIESAVSDLPEPLSPTMPTDSPARTEKPTPIDHAQRASCRPNSTTRSLDVEQRSASLADFRVEHVAHRSRR